MFKKPAAFLPLFFLFSLAVCGIFAACSISPEVKTQSAASEQPLELLEESITFQDGCLSFQIPQDFSGKWSILIYGRAELTDLAE